MTHINLYKKSELFDDTKIHLIKNMYFKGLTDDELDVFLHVCRRTGLDPLLKQIYPVKRGTKQPNGSYKDTLIIQTGIDGYRLIAERTGKYAPGREPTFVYDEERRLLSSTAYVKKQTVDGTWHEVPATAFYDEYCQKTKSGEPTRFWKDMPHGQLSKCAESLALRKAFPEPLSGLYTQEEMQQSEVLNEAPVKVLEAPEEEESIELQLPLDVDSERVDQYLHVIAEQGNRKIVDIKKRAAQNIEGFIQTFRKWQDKQFPLSEVLEA